MTSVDDTEGVLSSKILEQEYFLRALFVSSLRAAMNPALRPRFIGRFMHYGKAPQNILFASGQSFSIIPLEWIAFFLLSSRGQHKRSVLSVFAHLPVRRLCC